MTTTASAIPGPRTESDTLVELAGYLVDLRRAEQAEDVATSTVLLLEVAVGALHAALEPVRDAVRWHVPTWRFTDSDLTPDLVVPLPLAPSVLARLKDAPARLLEILADVDAATAAMQRLVEDIDEDQAAAHTRLHHHGTDIGADEDLRSDDADGYDSEVDSQW
jgi:hypothetical protein